MMFFARPLSVLQNVSTRSRFPAALSNNDHGKGITDGTEET